MKTLFVNIKREFDADIYETILIEDDSIRSQQVRWNCICHPERFFDESELQRLLSEDILTDVKTTDPERIVFNEEIPEGIIQKIKEILLTEEDKHVIPSNGLLGKLYNR